MKSINGPIRRLFFFCFYYFLSVLLLFIIIIEWKSKYSQGLYRNSKAGFLPWGRECKYQCLPCKSETGIHG